MNKILLGVLFLILDINITPAEGMVIGLIPDFVGYLLLWKGAKEYFDISKYFGRVSVVGQILAVYSGLLYVNDIFHLLSAINILMPLFEVLSVAGMLLEFYWLVKGFLDVEDQINYELKSKQLFYIWCVLAVFAVLRIVTHGIAYVGGVFGIGTYVMSFLYIVFLFRTKCYYDDALAEIIENK